MFVLLGVGVGGNVEKTPRSSAQFGSHANKPFWVLICTQNVGSHRCCLVSSLPGLRVQYLNKAWIYTTGKIADFSNNSELGDSLSMEGQTPVTVCAWY